MNGQDVKTQNLLSPASEDKAGEGGQSFDETLKASTIFLSSKRWITTVAVLFSISVVTLVICLSFGAERVSFSELASVLSAFFQEGTSGVEALGVPGIILLQVRLPRVLLGFLVGGSLAAVGVGLQALLRNPLAEPYVLGISSGAAFGATLGILFGVTNTVIGLPGLTLWAFMGGLLSIMVVYQISVSYRMLSVHTLLLAGVILNALFSALIMFVVSVSDPTRAFKMMLWLMGTLTTPDTGTLLFLFIAFSCGIVVLFGLARSLNVLTMGEESAKSLGVEVERTKKFVFVISALLTGATVSISGLIGFVGMIVPHAVRMFCGPDHRLVLPAAALVGGAFLTMADTMARSLFAPSELPVGVVTALIGGPVFLYFLVKRRAGIPF